MLLLEQMLTNDPDNYLGSHFPEVFTNSYQDFPQDVAQSAFLRLVLAEQMPSQVL